MKENIQNETTAPHNLFSFEVETNLYIPIKLVDIGPASATIAWVTFARMVTSMYSLRLVPCSLS